MTEAIFCSDAVKLAQVFSRGAWQDDALKALANLPSDKSSHAEENLHSWLTDAFGIELEPYYIDVTVKSDNPLFPTKTVQLATIPFFEYVAAAYAAGPKVQDPQTDLPQ